MHVALVHGVGFLGIDVVGSIRFVVVVVAAVGGGFVGVDAFARGLVGAAVEVGGLMAVASVVALGLYGVRRFLLG